MKTEHTSENIINWMRETVEKTGLKDVVIGFSGGIDSALAATLATRALGRDHVFVALLPFGDLNAKGVTDARKVIEFLQIPEDHVFKIDIKDGVEAILSHVISNEVRDLEKVMQDS